MISPDLGAALTTITTRGAIDERAIEQLEPCAAAGDALAGVLCADGHVGYSQPIGGALAYPDHISPSGVGYDIGCGNKAVRTNLLAADIAGGVSAIVDEIVERVSFGVGRKNDEPVDRPVLDRIRQAEFAPQRGLVDKAAQQLGTVGSGNHYVALFEGDDGYVWIGVHFGSRGFGRTTASVWPWPARTPSTRTKTDGWTVEGPDERARAAGPLVLRPPAPTPRGR